MQFLELHCSSIVIYIYFIQFTVCFINSSHSLSLVTLSSPFFFFNSLIQSLPLSCPSLPFHFFSSLFSLESRVWCGGRWVWCGGAHEFDVVVGMGDWGCRCGLWVWVRWRYGSWVCWRGGRLWQGRAWRAGSRTHGRGEWVLILVVGVDGAWLMHGFLSWWLMGLTAIGLGWRFVDGLFVGLARFRVWIGAVGLDWCCCGRVLWLWLLVVVFGNFFVFLFLLVVVSSGCCWWWVWLWWWLLASGVVVARWPFSCGFSCYGWGLGLFIVEKRERRGRKEEREN